MITRLFHIHHVIACLEVGSLDQAASWIERELGEENYDIGYGSVDPATIKVYDSIVEFELYKDTKQGLDGEGI
jgi:hypothetical protein